MGKRKNKARAKTVVNVKAEEVSATEAQKLAELQREMQAFRAKHGDPPHPVGKGSPFTDVDREHVRVLGGRARDLGVNDAVAAMTLGISLATYVRWIKGKPVMGTQGSPRVISETQALRVGRSGEGRPKIAELVQRTIALGEELSVGNPAVRTYVTGKMREELGALVWELRRYGVGAIAVSCMTGLSTSLLYQLHREYAAREEGAARRADAPEPTSVAASNGVTVTLPNGTVVAGTMEEIAALISKL